MRVNQQEKRAQYHAVRSRLGDSLIRLHKNIEQTRQREDQLEEMFENWQLRWSRRRDQIMGRLEMIESHLQEINKPNQEQSAPHLSIVGSTVDRDDVRSMADL